MEKTNDPDISTYLKSLLEGKSDVYFNCWFSRHSSRLEEMLSRGDYLKIKFDPLGFAKKWLAKEGVEYEPSKAAMAYQEFLLTFDSRLLDEKGDLRRDKFLSLFDGIPADYYSKKEDQAIEKIEKYLKKKKGKNTEILSEGVVDIVYFFQSLAHVDSGLSAFGIFAVKEYFKKLGLNYSEIELPIN